MSNIVIPKFISKAFGTPQWKTTVLEEIKAKTWRLEELPLDKKIIGRKWVFTIKYNAKGSIERHKAWLVVKGFT